MSLISDAAANRQIEWDMLERTELVLEPGLL